MINSVEEICEGWIEGWDTFLQVRKDKLYLDVESF